MNKYSFFLSLFLAYLLLASSFHLAEKFWTFFPLSMLLMIGWACYQEGVTIRPVNWFIIVYGVLSGILLYIIFFFGKLLIVWLNLPLLQGLTDLYRLVSPRLWWHYLVLWVIIIPGEELFWRGYIQQRLIRTFSPLQSILLGTLLYAVAHLYSGSFLLVMAALVGGVFWGILYHRTGSIGAVILSHLIFDLLLLVLFPLL